MLTVNFPPKAPKYFRGFHSAQELKITNRALPYSSPGNIRSSGCVTHVFEAPTAWPFSPYRTSNCTYFSLTLFPYPTSSLSWPLLRGDSDNGVIKFRERLKLLKQLGTKYVFYLQKGNTLTRSNFLLFVKVKINIPTWPTRS